MRKRLVLVVLALAFAMIACDQSTSSGGGAQEATVSGGGEESPGNVETSSELGPVDPLKYYGLDGIAQYDGEEYASAENTEEYPWPAEVLPLDLEGGTLDYLSLTSDGRFLDRGGLGDWSGDVPVGTTVRVLMVLLANPSDPASPRRCFIESDVSIQGHSVSGWANCDRV